MSKPIVFICHSSKDERMVKKLKELLIKKVGSTLDIFASSDGQSIPLGRNWVYEIEQALENSRIVFVFLSPNSIRSNWIYFEAGFAYSKGIKVIPIGVLGVDLYQVPPPMSLLQGFNINSLETLNNLISILNKEFNYTLETVFSYGEYAEIFGIQKVETSNILKEYISLVYEIGAQVAPKIDKPIEAIVDYFKSHKVEHKSEERMVDTYGMSILNTEGLLTFKMAQNLLDSTIPLVSDTLRLVQGNSFQFYPLTIDFVPSVNCIEEKHQISSRVFKTDIKIADNYNFSYSDIVFSIGRRYSLIQNVSGAIYTIGASSMGGYEYKVGNVYMEIKYYGDNLAKIPIYNLLNKLFELGILY